LAYRILLMVGLMGLCVTIGEGVPPHMQKNVEGGALELCNDNPVTGYFRDGYCRTDDHDYGSHTVCAEVTNEWLDFQKMSGNDLKTPHPQFGFPGLKPGDKWCLCAGRWKQGVMQGLPLRVIINATNMRALEDVSSEDLFNNHQTCNTPQNDQDL
jgi:uncharacterized protein (DUF2237 family)